MNSKTPSSHHICSMLMALALVIFGANHVSAMPQGPNTPHSVYIPILSRPPCEMVVPSGWYQAVPGAVSGTIGVNLSMALDGCGDPMLAYNWNDPNGDTDYADSALYFKRFVRNAGAWGAPVLVDNLNGETPTSAPSREVSLARDPNTGKIGIAYTVSTPNGLRVKLAVSGDEGQTWNKEFLPIDDGIHATSSPALAMSRGKIYVAYYETFVGGHFVSRPGYGGSFNDQHLPGLPNTDPTNLASSPLSVKTDASGNPGVAYMLSASQDAGVAYTVTVAFWRPGPAGAVKVMDSNGVQNDGPSLSLAFDGVDPRVVAVLCRTSSCSADSGLWFSWSVNGGSSFIVPFEIPRDSSDSFDWYTALALDSRHGATAVTYSNGGTDVHICGKPKVSTSPDLTHWATCGITAPDDPNSGYYNGHYMNAAFNPFDKLMISMQADMSGATGGGALFYRAP